jgi:hypothetical protein
LNFPFKLKRDVKNRLYRYIQSRVKYV